MNKNDITSFWTRNLKQALQLSIGCHCHRGGDMRTCFFKVCLFNHKYLLQYCWRGLWQNLQLHTRSQKKVLTERRDLKKGKVRISGAHMELTATRNDPICSQGLTGR